MDDLTLLTDFAFVFVCVLPDADLQACHCTQSSRSHIPTSFYTPSGASYMSFSDSTAWHNSKSQHTECVTPTRLAAYRLHQILTLDTLPTPLHSPRTATRRRTRRTTYRRRRSMALIHRCTRRRGRAVYTTDGDTRARARGFGPLPRLLILTSQGFTSTADAARSTFRILQTAQHLTSYRFSTLYSK